MLNYTIFEVASHLGLSLPINNLTSKKITQFAVDSRQVACGAIFFALDGQNVDGASFLAEAAKNGAVAIVIKYQDQIPDCCQNIAVLRVECPLKALQKLMSVAIEKSHAKVIAVTGSVGKSTVKDFLKQLLSIKFKVFASLGNHNSQIGLPLTILNNLQPVDFIVLEIGMSRAGEISNLVKLAKPEFVIITKVDYSHAENFNSLEEIAKAKLEILDSPNLITALIPLDLKNFQLPPGSIEFFSAENESADYFLIDKELFIKSQSLRVSFGSLKLLGLHNYHNFMLAAVAANYFGISYKEIMQADVKLQLPRLRLENKFINGVHFILDCYNASLASFKAAFSSIFDLKNSRKIGLFGYMGELGQFSAICHEEVATEALKLFDILVVIGKDCQPMLSIWQAAGKEIYLYNNKDDVLPKLKQILQKGDLVLVKGSRINKLEDIIAAYESSL